MSGQNPPWPESLPTDKIRSGSAWVKVSFEVMGFSTACPNPELIFIIFIFIVRHTRKNQQ